MKKQYKRYYCLYIGGVRATGEILGSWTQLRVCVVFSVYGKVVLLCIRWDTFNSIRIELVSCERLKRCM